MDEKRDKLEKEMSQTLIEGEMQKDDPTSTAKEQLIPRYEIRIPVKKDPIIEETRIFREMAKEADNRYDDIP